VAGSCEYGDEPAGSGATELVISFVTCARPDEYLGKHQGYILKFTCSSHRLLVTSVQL
jgi:hypothetical protein